MAEVPFVVINNDILMINNHALQHLGQDEAPRPVLSIIGASKTGKSSLIDFLQNSDGLRNLPTPTFDQSHKGLWISRRVIPSSSPEPVFLISRGLFNSPKGRNQDLIILALAIVISDVLLLTTNKILDLDTLQILSQASQIALAMMPKGQSTPPAFIWTPRDLDSQLALDGMPCSPVEFIDNSLNLQPGFTIEIIATNLFRKNIATFFYDRCCIPLPRTMMSHSEGKFLLLQQTVLAKLQNPKMTKLSELFKQVFEYRDLIQNSSSFVIGIHPTFETETLKATNEDDEIIATMRQKILNLRSALPLSSKRLNNHIRTIKSESDQAMREKFDDQIASKLEEKIDNAFLDLSSELLEANEKASNAKCLRLLRSYFAEIESNLTSGKYSCKGSPDLLEADFEVVKKKYFSESKKDHFGPEVSRTLKNFQQNTVSEFKFLGTVCLAICRVQHNLFRGSITVPLACCLTGLDSAALLKFNQIQIYLLGQIQTGGRMYSDASPPLFHPFNCT